MAEYEVERDDTIPLQISVTRRGGVNGLFPVVALRDGTQIDTPVYLDWDDSAFKVSGWTTRLQTLTQVDTVLAPGRYAYANGLDLSSVSSLPLNPSKLIAEFEVRNAAGTPVGVGDDVYTLKTHAYIEVARYQGFIWLDVSRGAAGQEIGVNGTQLNPVTNMVDALALADQLGFRRFHITGATTLNTDHFDTDFVGARGSTAQIDLNDQRISDSRFERMTLVGTMNSSGTFRQCFINAVKNFFGTASECVFDGVTTVRSGFSRFFRCGPLEPQGVAIIEIDGPGSQLQMLGLSGDWEIRGMVNAVDAITMDFESGGLILGPTNVMGALDLRGIGTLIDSNGGVTLTQTAWLDRQQIAVYTNSVLSGAHGSSSWEGTDATSIAAAVDTTLTAAHGAGPWNIATNVLSIAAATDLALSVSHGGGSWLTATGFAVAGDEMNLTPAALNSVVTGSVGTDPTSTAAAVESVLSASHGTGSWTTAVAVVATNVGSIAAETDTVLSSSHGLGSWEGITVQNILDGVVDATGATTITVQKALQFSFASLVNTVLKAGQVYIYHDVGGSALWAGFDNDPVSWGSSII